MYSIAEDQKWKKKGEFLDFTVNDLNYGKYYIYIFNVSVPRFMM